jgi:hypothetical protein
MQLNSEIPSILTLFPQLGASEHNIGDMQQVMCNLDYTWIPTAVWV